MKVGHELGPSEWVRLDADKLAMFGQATYLKDRLEADWRVSENNELGPKLIDGFMLTSLILPFHGSIWPYYDEGTWALNYGLDRVRFIEPVFIDDRIRMSSVVKDVEPRDRGLRVTTTNVLEIEGRERPAMVADWVILYMPADKGGSR